MKAECNFQCEYTGCRCNESGTCTEDPHFCPAHRACGACVNDVCEKKMPGTGGAVPSGKK